MRCAVFVDAGYLFAAGSELLTGSQQKRSVMDLDIEKAIKQLRDTANEATGQVQLLRILWYDGMVGARRNGLTPQESAEKQGLGRSKGGFTTKIVFMIAETDKVGQVMDFTLLPGQRHDIKGVPALPDWANIEEYKADRGFDADSLRQLLAAQGITSTIPPRRNRKEPRPYDEVSYKGRNKVERVIGHIKEFRSIATRYEKLAATYAGFIQLACWQYATK